MPRLALDEHAIKIDFTEQPMDAEVFSLEGVEQLSRPFQYRVELVLEDEPLELNSLIGQPAVVTMLDTAGNADRYIQGVVAEVSSVGFTHNYFRFSILLVPPVWMLGMRQQFRVFQNKTVTDLIKEVFTAASLPSNGLEYSFQGSYSPREYCVQYRETDLDFVHRLMEEEGIYYFFRHEPEGLKMIIADHLSIHETSQFSPTIPFNEGGGLVEESYTVNHLTHYSRLVHSRMQLGDYNYIKPALDLTQFEETGGFAGAEWSDYPGNFSEAGTGKARVKILSEIEQVRKNSIQARGFFQPLVPGMLFTLEDYPVDELNQEHLVTYIRLTLTQPGVLRESAGGEPEKHMEMQCIPSAIQFRAPVTTPRPSVRGIQTAVVTGPAGEEIYTDEYGRIKVAFPWDQSGTDDEHSSCWIRVNQGWSGAGWGSLFLPRIGSEVIVDFVDGNPDRPLVTGQVYHAVNKPPYELPAHSTRSTIRTSSSKGGDGFNEIRFEDKAGEEELYLHAHRQMSEFIGEKHISVVGDEKHSTVVKSQMKSIGEHSHLTVGQNMNLDIGETLSLRMGSDQQIEVGENFGLDAGNEIHLKSTTLVLDGNSEITIKAGGSFIRISGSGVDISGPIVNLNSGGSPGSGSSVSLESAEPPLELEADEAPAVIERPPRPTAYSPAAMVLKQAAIDGTPFCEQCSREGGGS